LADQLAAHALHIQGPLAHPVAQGGPQNRRAAVVDAAGVRLPLLPRQEGAAFRAAVGQGQWRGPGGAQIYMINASSSSTNPLALRAVNGCCLSFFPMLLFRGHRETCCVHDRDLRLASIHLRSLHL
jgi:hypothetical protein